MKVLLRLRSHSTKQGHIIGLIGPHIMTGRVTAFGRPPTISGPRHLMRVGVSAWTGRRCAFGSRRQSAKYGIVRHRDRTQTRSEPGLADKAVEIAEKVLDTDLKEVLETVQTASSDAVVTTAEAIQARLLTNLLYHLPILSRSWSNADSCHHEVCS